MKFKPTLNKLASIAGVTGLSLMFSSSLHAAPFFEVAAGKNIAQAELSAGDLVATKPSIENAQVYRINAQALSNSTEQLELNLLPGFTVYANKQSTAQSASGGLIWNGQVASTSKKSLKSIAATDSAMLINRDGKITGTVRVQGRLFNIRPLESGLHMVTEINEANMKPDHPPGAMAEMENDLNQRLADQPYLFSTDTTDNAINNLANPVIKVLVLYSNGVPSEVADIPGLVDLAIAETNQGYVNSGINATVELAHLTSVNYSTSSISTDLSRLKSTSDGYMDNAHSLRDQYGADIVMLLVPDSGSACGQAGAIGATASTAFAVTAQDCATGYYSFGHEMGHLQSARHNPETDGTNNPYSFGHGYRDPSNQWRTVMAYNCTSNCSRINWWSNPSKTRNGVAMGTTSTSDNARVLNLTAATVAGFRDGSVTPPEGGSYTNNNLGASKGNWLHYTIEVPAGMTNLTVNTAGGSGDGDLYVRQGAQPTTTQYNCRPYKNGNTETCSFSNPAAGTWYLSVRAYSTFSGLNLSATWAP